MSGEPNSPASGEIDWETFAQFSRELFHDIRNQLNALELQLVLAGELVENGEARQPIDQGRTTVSELGQLLARLRRHMVPPELEQIPCQAQAAVELTREAVQPLTLAAGPVEGEVRLDPQPFAEALKSLVEESLAADQAAGPVEVFADKHAIQILIGGEPAPNDPPASWLSGQLDYGLRLPGALATLRRMQIDVDWRRPMRFALRIPLTNPE